MKPKSPILKALVGKQNNLPAGLKAKIEAAPESPTKKDKPKLNQAQEDTVMSYLRNKPGFEYLNEENKKKINDSVSRLGGYRATKKEAYRQFDATDGTAFDKNKTKDSATKMKKESSMKMKKQSSMKMKKQSSMKMKKKSSMGMTKVAGKTLKTKTIAKKPTDRKEKIAKNIEFNKVAEQKGLKPPRPKAGDAKALKAYEKFYSNKANVNMLNKKQKEYFKNKKSLSKMKKK